MVTTSIVV